MNLKFADARVKSAKWLNTGHGSPWVETHTAGRARAILNAARQRMNPDAKSRINPSFTVAQVHQILWDGVSLRASAEEIPSLIAKNIEREFGRYFVMADVIADKEVR